MIESGGGGELFESECGCGCKFQYDSDYPLLVKSNKYTYMVGHYIQCPDCGMFLGAIYDPDGNQIACVPVGPQGRFVALFNDYCEDITLKRRYFGRDKTKTW